MDTTPNPVTPDCLKDGKEEVKRLHKLYHLERFLRKELRRFDLRHREQTIADVILQASYGFGKTSVIIPKLDIFVEMTGITRGNVHTSLKNLHSMEIITVDTSRHTVEYTINPNPNKWRCRERATRLQVRRALEYLKMANGITENIDKDVQETINEITGKSDSKTDSIPDPETDENFKNRSNAQFLPGLVPNEETVPLLETRIFPNDLT